MTTHARQNLRAAGRAAAICLGAIILAAAPMSVGFAAQAAAANPAPPSGDGALPPNARELLTSLAQEWLEEQGVAKSAPVSPAQETGNSFEDYVSSDFGAIHDQIVVLVRAVPDLPNEFERAAARVTAIQADAGRGQVFLDLGIFGDRYYVATRRLAAEAQALLNLAIFGALSFGAEWLFRKMTGGFAAASTGSPWRPSKIVCVSSLRVSPLLSARLQPSSSAASAPSSPSIGIRSVAR